jgi:hypothetical protein
MTGTITDLNLFLGRDIGWGSLGGFVFGLIVAAA